MFRKVALVNISEEQRNQFLGIAGRKKPNRITIGYCRVSSNKQKDDLERQDLHDCTRVSI